MSVHTRQSALGELAAAYQSGRLVPFTGSGMSFPLCASWEQLILELRRKLGLTVRPTTPNGAAPDSSLLVREADEAMILLRAYPVESRLELIRGVLYMADKGDQCVNSEALAQLHWPLIITTNYDDVYVRKCAAAPRVLGRGNHDCEQVLASLTSVTGRILWAIQGFVGSSSTSIPDEIRRNRLASELVLSHKQYQEAITGAPNFRRVFAEVFRHRTLLFLGSGILEDYLINLFSEVMSYTGPPVHGHFALMHRARFDGVNAAHAEFLVNRLHIRPIFYEKHEEVPAILADLGKRVKWFAPGSNQQPDGLSHFETSSLVFRAVGAGEFPRVELCHDSLSLTATAQTVISVGRMRRPDGNEQLWFGSMVRSVIGMASFTKVPDTKYSYVCDGKPEMLAVAARSPDADGKLDPRDLNCISPAIKEVLEVAATRAAAVCGSEMPAPDIVHLGLIAAGDTRAWHPIFSLTEMLRGIRLFFTGSSQAANLKRIVIMIVDPGVWLAVVSSRIPISRLLSSDVLTVRVGIQSPDSQEDVFIWTGPHGSTVAEIMQHFKLKFGVWRAILTPHPSGNGGQDVGSATMVAALAELKFHYVGDPG